MTKLCLLLERKQIDGGRCRRKERANGEQGLVCAGQSVGRDRD